MRLYIWAGPLLFLMFLLWVQSNPAALLKLVARLRRRFRQHVINRHGRIWAEWVAKDFRKYAAQKGYDKTVTERLIKEQWDEMVKALGEASANKHLGPSHFIDENF